MGEEVKSVERELVMVVSSRGGVQLSIKVGRDGGNGPANLPAELAARAPFVNFVNLWQWSLQPSSPQSHI